MSKFKVGDKVRFAYKWMRNCEIDIGDTGVVVKVEENTYFKSVIHVHRKDKKTIGDYVYTVSVKGNEYKDYENSLELFEEKPSPKFKVGDRVRVFGKTLNNFTCEIGKITGKRESTEDQWFVEAIEGKIGNKFDSENYIKESDMELIEEYLKLTFEPTPLGSSGTITVSTSGTTEWFFIDQTFKEQEYPINTTNKKKTTMNKISTFIKNVTLSADEKLLRKHGLHDSDGNNTDDAKDAIDESIYNSKESQTYLLSIAEGLEKEAKADCKK